MKYNITQEKTFAFAVRITNMYLHLTKVKKEFVLSKQTVRAGTSIAANIEEGIGAQSDRDFFAKISISYKEARETHFWLRLLKATNILSAAEADSLLADCDELLKILGTIKKKIEAK